MEEALESLDNALQLNPGDVEAWAFRAEMMNSLGHFEEGCISAERAIELDPLHPDAYVYRAHSLSKLGRGQEAKRGLEKAIVLIPSDQKLRKARDGFVKHGG
jgi:superkiller protein 3